MPQPPLNLELKLKFVRNVRDEIDSFLTRIMQQLNAVVSCCVSCIYFMQLFHAACLGSAPCSCFMLRVLHILYGVVSCCVSWICSMQLFHAACLASTSCSCFMLRVMQHDCLNRHL